MKNNILKLMLLGAIVSASNISFGEPVSETKTREELIEKLNAVEHVNVNVISNEEIETADFCAILLDYLNELFKYGIIKEDRVQSSRFFANRYIDALIAKMSNKISPDSVFNDKSIYGPVMPDYVPLLPLYDYKNVIELLRDNKIMTEEYAEKEITKVLNLIKRWKNS